ncbi:hypothetical protein [Methanosarcina mazei]|uniref:hypothetical protein n=1 Tax=Methanosarcina mazei TaxID=2209 RepID=UPI000AEECBC3|nr:hypothetical protein [Methanosarcina mazei]
MLKIGYKIGAEQFLPSEMLEQAIVAEKNGFESIDVSDHLRTGMFFLELAWSRSCKDRDH